MDESGGLEKGQQTQTSITEIQPIEKSRDEMIPTKDKIREFVEPPLVNACEILWDQNLRTLSSSANAKDIGHKAYIIVDYNSLSDNNKEVAQSSGELIEDYDGKPAVIFEIPVHEATTAEEIEADANRLAGKFQKQEASWIPSYTLSDMRKWYGIAPDDDEYGVEDFRKEGFYYDQESKRFYLSQEHFQKATEKVE